MSIGPFFSFPANITVGLSGTSVVINGSTSGSLTLQVPAIVTSYTITFPAAQGAAGTLLKNDGSGNLSWTTAATTTINVDTTATSANSTFYPLFVASPTSATQAPAVDSGFTYNPSTNALAITGNFGAGGAAATTLISGQSAADFTAAGTTTVNASKAIVGSSTTFLSQIYPGDEIAVSSATATYASVLTVTDDTHLATASNLGNGTASTTISVKKALARLMDPTGATQFVVTPRGQVIMGPYAAADSAVAGSPGWLTVISPIATNTMIGSQANSDCRMILRRFNATVTPVSGGVGNVISSPTKVLSTQTIGILGYQGFQEATGSYVVSAASMTAVATEDFTNTANGTKLVYSTTPNTTVSPAVALTLDQDQSVVCGNAAIATNATGGFLYMTSCNGTPTGTPVTNTGRVPWVYDTANNIIYVYNGGWKKTVALTV